MGASSEGVSSSKPHMFTLRTTLANIASPLDCIGKLSREALHQSRLSTGMMYIYKVINSLSPEFLSS